MASSSGCTASGLKKLIRMLISKGADIDAKANFGTPLQRAAGRGKKEAVKILLDYQANPNLILHHIFSPLVVSILAHSFECVKLLLQRKREAREIFLMSKSKGEDAFKRKDYINAIYWYTEAINSDSSDATILSNRSLCWACLNEGDRALSDAQACLMLRPDWPKAYYREGVAWKLLNDFDRAAGSFYDGLKLDPENKELQHAFCEAVFDPLNVPQQM